MILETAQYLEISEQLMPRAFSKLELFRQMISVCLIIAIVVKNDSGCTWIRLVGATALGDRPVIGIARTIGVGGDLLIGIVQTIEF